MTGAALDQFEHVWLMDFEFHQPDGERPAPICMVAREFHTGLTVRYWADELATMSGPPFSIGPDSLLVAFYASAELGCFRAMGWPMPARILDLFCEFRNHTNGLVVPCGNGLLGALAFHGLDAIGAVEKDSMRDLAIRGGPYTETERRDLLAYCETDVAALARLLPVMLPTIDLPRALLRGRYMAAVAAMEWTGVPIDVFSLETLRKNWRALQGELIDRIDSEFGVFVPAGRELNPESTLGGEILRTAEDWRIDPYALAEVADAVWHEERQAVLEQQEALTAARAATGLTAGRIANWENRGRDYSTWPGLDVRARELAAELPALGIGTGFEHGTGFDDTDYARALWDLLRAGARPARPKHDRGILTRAAEMVAVGEKVPRTERRSFNVRRFAEWLARSGIPWPRLDSGLLALDDDTFRQMSRAYPVVAPLRELRHSLGEMRLLADLAVGSDDRNRCLLSPFRSTTGRNQPSNARFIFGPATWTRALIQPEQGRAVAYIDWAQQEFGIAAALSGDGAMMGAYASGDPYLTFAKQAGAVPSGATKESHREERAQFKICALAVQYGMGAKSLAQSLCVSEAKGRQLLELHRQTYPAFWKWSEGAVNHAMLRGWLQTAFGWRIRVGVDSNPRSLANFPMQANGAEMIRLACCLATERHIEVCAPVHDALLVEGPIDRMVDVVAETRAAMGEASRIVLDGFELQTDAEIICWPDRYMDGRGVKMWNTIMGLLAETRDEHPKRSCSAGNTPGPSYKESYKEST